MPKKSKKKLDLENTKQGYWDNVLRSFGLGTGREPTKQESAGIVDRTSIGQGNSKMEQLDRLMDSEDLFKWGHEIKSVRVEERQIPEWAIGDQGIKSILFTAFPKLAIDERQRRYAGVWLRVFYLYYRLGMTYSQVAKETGISEGRIRSLLGGISYTAQGLDRHGKPRKRLKGSKLSKALRETVERKNEGVQGPHVPSSGDGSVGEEGAVS